MKTVHFVAATFFLSLSLSRIACGQGIERRSSVKGGKVEGVVDGSLESVKSKIVEIFKAKYQTRVEHPEDIYTGFFPSSKDSSEISFPDDLQLKAWIRENKQLKHKDLIEYLNLSEQLRKSDIYLADFDLRYWYSEYYLDGKPVKFKTNFFIHLEPEGTTQTKIQIFQYQPQIWIGKKFGIGHAGPAYTNDTRWVEPTGKDSLELLVFISDNIKQSKEH
jgi:hypothetical protein